MKLVRQLFIALAFRKCKNNFSFLYLTLFCYTSFVRSTKIPPCFIGFRLSLFLALCQDDRKAARDGRRVGVTPLSLFRTFSEGGKRRKRSFEYGLSLAFAKNTGVLHSTLSLPDPARRPSRAAFRSS